MCPRQEEDRKTFFARLPHLLTDEQLWDIEHAYLIAKAAHRYDERTGETDEEGNPLRYFEHPRRVAIILMDQIGCHEPLLICAALLHDVPEDAHHITLHKLERWFHSPTLAGLVAKISKIPKQGYLGRLQECAKHGDWQPVLLKLCDRLHNMRSLENCARDFQRKQGDETRRDYLPLFAGLLKRLPSVYIGGATKALEEMRYLVGRYETKPEELVPQDTD